jgi:hypothetical protein
VDFDQLIVADGTALAIATNAVLAPAFLNGTTPSSALFWRANHAWTVIDGPAGNTTRFSDGKIVNGWMEYGYFTNNVVSGDVILRWVPAGTLSGNILRVL